MWYHLHIHAIRIGIWSSDTWHSICNLLWLEQASVWTFYLIYFRIGFSFNSLSSSCVWHKQKRPVKERKNKNKKFVYIQLYSLRLQNMRWNMRRAHLMWKHIGRLLELRQEYFFFHLCLLFFLVFLWFSSSLLLIIIHFCRGFLFSHIFSCSHFNASSNSTDWIVFLFCWKRSDSNSLLRFMCDRVKYFSCSFYLSCVVLVCMCVCRLFLIFVFI